MVILRPEVFMALLEVYHLLHRVYELDHVGVVHVFGHNVELVEKRVVHKFKNLLILEIVLLGQAFLALEGFDLLEGLGHYPGLVEPFGTLLDVAALEMGVFDHFLAFDVQVVDLGHKLGEG